MFLEVFSYDIYVVHPNSEIDFGIDTPLHTLLISIPSYRMASAKMKEFKDQFKVLLGKSFIQQSFSS